MSDSSSPVYIVDGCRTPYLRAEKKQGPFSASDLAVAAGRELISRHSFNPEDIDETIFGCMMPSENEANIGRIIGLRLGCGKKTPGWTVQRNCASGMQALDCAFKDIMLGRAGLVLAGGTETMSRAPLIYNKYMTEWFGSFMRAKSAGQKISLIFQLRPKYFAPIIALLKGLTDPVCGLTMPQTAEVLAQKFNITREDMDEFALLSQQRAAKSYEEKHMGEVISIYGPDGKVYDQDNGIRTDTSLEKLAKLRSVSGKYGLVTAGNSSQITDGAACMLLANEEEVEKYNLPVIAKVLDVHWAGLDPNQMGLGPVFASVPLLQKHNLKPNDIDYWEINEAFAAQVIACQRAFGSKEFCKQEFDLDEAIGEIDSDKLNVDGGAIALGHPVGSSGTRIVLHLAETLKRTNTKLGMAAICIGGGQGGAMLIERVDGK